MGRKKLSSKIEEKTTVPENTNAGAELVSENTSLSVYKVDLGDERKNASRKRVEWDPSIQVHFFESSPSTKMPRTMGSPVRKSRRLQNAALALNMEADRLAQEMTIRVSDDEDEPANDVEASLGDKNLEEQVEYLLRVFKEQHKVLNALKSKTTKAAPSKTSGKGEVTYKGLYINSQKKLKDLDEKKNQLHKKTEALIEENHQLHKKLEYALGKIEVFEKGNHVFSNVLEKMKGVIVCSLTKDPEAAANILSEAFTRQ